MSMLAKAAFAASARMDRTAIPLAPPTLGGTVAIGNSPTVTYPGAWSRGSGDYLYTLLRDGSPVIGATHVPQAVFESYMFVADDIGPQIDIRVHNLLGGMTADSVSSIVFDSFTYLPRTALFIAEDAFVTGGVVSIWSPRHGGGSVTLTAAGAARPDYNPTGGVGGRALITTNGSSHIMTGTFTSGAPMTSYALGYAGQRVSYVASGTFLSYAGPATSSRLFYMSDTGAAFAGYTVTGGGGIAVHGGDPDGVNARVIGETNAGLGLNRAWLNGSITGTSASAAPTETDGYTFTFGGRANGAGDLFANWAVQAILITADITDDQLAHIDALMKYDTAVAA